MILSASGLNVTGFPDGHRAVVPPDPMPNSEVKRSIADGSVGSPHVRVGHCQGFMQSLRASGGFFYARKDRAQQKSAGENKEAHPHLGVLQRFRFLEHFGVKCY